jgi:acyl-CoA carboxylase epsilon subunit-like protein
VDGEPLLRVVRGDPTAEELAALVGVLLAHVRRVPSRPAPAVSRWARAARPAPGPRPGPGAWRGSALPY